MTPLVYHKDSGFEFCPLGWGGDRKRVPKWGLRGATPRCWVKLVRTWRVFANRDACEVVQGHSACAEGLLASHCLSPAIAALAVCAVVLNWVTTGDHLLRTISIGYWPVAGTDLFMLAGAVVAVVAARRLGRAAAVPAGAAREAAHV